MKKGYQLQVRSWENDGDNYKIAITSGLTEQDVKFLLDVGKQFGNGGSHGGNEVIDEEELVELVTTAMENNVNVSERILSYFKDAPVEATQEYLLDSPGEYYDYGFMRVFDTYRVFYIPTDIEDVTEQFK